MGLLIQTILSHLGLPATLPPTGTQSGKLDNRVRSLEQADGKWEREGTFPGEIDDVGVYWEDGVFHLFGEYGDYPGRPDGTSPAHYASRTGLGDWSLEDPKAVDPNPSGGNRFGVGDPTIAKINGYYYIYCDRETANIPYKVVAWRSASLYEPFEYLGPALVPRSNETDDWDNYRVQDAEIAYVPDPGMEHFVMIANMMDIDGDPGPDRTRVIGTFYSVVPTASCTASISQSSNESNPFDRVEYTWGASEAETCMLEKRLNGGDWRDLAGPARGPGNLHVAHHEHPGTHDFRVTCDSGCTAGLIHRVVAPLGPSEGDR